MDNLEEDERAEAYPHRELDTLYQVANAGMNLAIAAALDYCARHQVPAPQWVTERASSLLNALLHLEDKRARNKLREEMKEYQRNQLHYARYDAVKYAKEAREHLRGELDQLKKTKGRMRGEGPPYHRCGPRIVFYFVDELDAWLEVPRPQVSSNLEAPDV